MVTTREGTWTNPACHVEALSDFRGKLGLHSTPVLEWHLPKQHARMLRRST